MVRMCDTCSNVFSENAEGWSTGNMTVTKKNAEGRITPVTITQDKCPDCTQLMSAPMAYGRPEIQPTYNAAIPVTPDDDSARTIPGSINRD
jgi:hypothetical protein